MTIELLDHALDRRSDVTGAEGMALLSLRVRIANAGTAPIRLIKWTVHTQSADGWFLNPDAPLRIGDATIDPANLIFNLTAKPVAPGARIDGMCFALFRPADMADPAATAVRLVAIDQRDRRHEAEIALTR